MTVQIIGQSSIASRAGPRVASIAGLVVAAALLAGLRDLLSDYWLRTFISATALAIGSLSVSLLFGPLGMVSLAQFGLLGVGGWFALRVSHGFGVPFEVALLTGGVAAGFVGLVVGLPALRMRGLYLAIITLMMAGAIQVLISAFGFPDGGPGILGKAVGVARQMMARPFFAQGDKAYFRYAKAVLALCYLLVMMHVRGRPGRAWAMIRRGEVCALSGGVNIVASKGVGVHARGLSRRHCRRPPGGRRRPTRRFRLSRQPVDPAVCAHDRGRRL